MKLNEALDFFNINRETFIAACQTLQNTSIADIDIDNCHDIMLEMQGIYADASLGTLAYKRRGQDNEEWQQRATAAKLIHKVAAAIFLDQFL